jgi:hypothetical protein
VRELFKWALGWYPAGRRQRMSERRVRRRVALGQVRPGSKPRAAESPPGAIAPHVGHVHPTVPLCTGIVNAELPHTQGLG